MSEYVITNIEGNDFAKFGIKGRYEITPNLALADTYPTKEAALNVLKSRLPKKKFQGFCVAKLENGSLEEIFGAKKKSKSKKETKKSSKSKSGNKMPTKSTKPRKNGKTIAHEDSDEALIETPFIVDVQNDPLNDAVIEHNTIEATVQSFTYQTDDQHIQNWIDRLEIIKDIRREAEARKVILARLYDQIMDYDCDVLHFVEFSKQNASSRCKINTMQQQILQIRRKVKEELTVLDAILKDYTPDIEKILDNLYKTIENEKDRKYNPRTFNSLFKDGINSDNTQIQFQEFVENCKNLNVNI